MDDISNVINFELNENRPVLDNHKVNDNVINGSAENKLSAAESVAFLHSDSSPLTEKEVLTSVNNNFQNEKQNIHFPISEYSTDVINNVSGENISFLSSELGTKTENINSSSLACETPTSIETSNNISFKSVENICVTEDELKNDSDTKSAIPSLDEILVGNCSFLPDDLSDEVLNDNQKNLSFLASQFNKMSITEVENIDSTSTSTKQLKDSFVVVPDLVDFSFREQENVTHDLLGNFNAFGILSKKSDSSQNCVEVSAVSLQENKPLNTSAELLETDFANKIPNSPPNIHKESGVTDITENCAVVLSHSDSPLGMSKNPVEEGVCNVLTSGNTSLEFEKPSKAVSAVYCGKFDVSTHDELNKSEGAFQLLENTSSNEPDKVSPLKIEKVSFGVSDKSPERKVSFGMSEKSPERKISFGMADKSVEGKVSFGMSDKSLEEKVSFGMSDKSVEEKVSFGMSDKSLEGFIDPGFESNTTELSSNNPLDQYSDPAFTDKVPEVSSNNHIEQFSDSVFKVPEVPSNNPFGQFSDPDFAFKVPETPSNNPVEQNSATDFAFKMPETPLNNEDDEQFVDAAQFFKDPNSFQFLENIRTSTVQPESTVPRSSLYVNFDPLHSKFQTNVPRQDNCALITAAVQENIASVENSEECSAEVLNKHLVDVAARESLGNILISFDSPKSSTCVDSKTPVQTLTPPKMFTEEEVQQKLKIHELETQDVYIKKQREMEMQITKRDELLKLQLTVIEEFHGISVKLSEDAKNGQRRIMSLEAENEKLKEDVKTSSGEVQSVENTFADFYKRYEQSKEMLKTYKDNEEHLKQIILDLQTKAKEQEQMYHMLQERTEEMLEKANVEMDNVKRSGEAQVTVLKAQLKKAEMKISSLESDIKQIKIENSQLGGICDDLMAKVSRS